MFDGMTAAEIEAQFEPWLKQARQHRREVWVSLQMAEASVTRLEEEKAKCLSSCRPE